MLKVTNVKKKKKKKKVISRFCKKHNHIFRLWLKHQWEWYKTVGGVALTRYFLHIFIVLKHEKKSKLKM